MKVGDEYLDVMCAKTWSINFTTDMKETTTTQSGFWKEYRPRKMSYTASFNGVVMIIAPQDKPTIKSLFQNQLNFLPVNYRIIFKDNSDELMIITGQLFVTSTAFDANPINLLNGTIQFQGNGPVEITDEIPEFIDLTVSITTLDTATGKFRFVLVDENSAIIFDTATLPETAGSEGWMVPDQVITKQVLSGNYYFGFTTNSINSDENVFDLNTPSPGPVHMEFDHENQEYNSSPVLHDFTAARTASLNIGTELPPPPCVPVFIIGIPSLPDGQVNVPYNYTFEIDGTAPIGLTINERPAWMNIAIIGDDVVFSGTPDTDGVGIGISITLSNCSGATTDFSDSIDVSAAPIGQPTIFWEMYRSGRLIINRNGVRVVDATTFPSLGNFAALAGDVIQPLLQAPGRDTSGLTITDSVDGVIYVDTGMTPLGTAFVAALGHNYTIVAYDV
jgi:hypothetical protein